MCYILCSVGSEAACLIKTLIITEDYIIYKYVRISHIITSIYIMLEKHRL